MTRPRLQAALTMTDMTVPTAVDMLITELRLLGPTDRLLGLYEVALEGCAARDLGQVEAVLHELMSALDFQYPEIAESFHRLYMFCSEQVNVGGFERVGFVLCDLRDTLQRAVNEHALAQAASVAS